MLNRSSKFTVFSLVFHHNGPKWIDTSSNLWYTAFASVHFNCQIENLRNGPRQLNLIQLSSRPKWNKMLYAVTSWKMEHNELLPSSTSVLISWHKVVGNMFELKIATYISISLPQCLWEYQMNYWNIHTLREPLHDLILQWASEMHCAVLSCIRDYDLYRMDALCNTI